jgi:uncharacterized protein (DUF2141 family)
VKLLCGTLLAFMLAASAAMAADINVTILGVRNSNGVMRVGLYDNAGDFPNGLKFASIDVPAVAGSMTVIFERIPAGRYAIAILHDENSNGRMDMGLFSIPQEGYGFSRDALVFLSPPSFEEAAFDVPEEGMQARLHVNY